MKHRWFFAPEVIKRCGDIFTHRKKAAQSSFGSIPDFPDVVAERHLKTASASRQT